MTALGSWQVLELRRTLDRLWSEVAAQVPDIESGGLASAELALYAPAGPLRLAVDEVGHRHILVPLEADDREAEGWLSTGVQLQSSVRVVDEDPVRFLDLQCLRDDLHGVFTGLAADVCAVVASEKGLTGKGLSTMLESWRELLGGRRQVWTVPRLAGLYGELLVLEQLLEHDPAATSAWTGPTGAPQDFRFRGNALEVKTTTAAVGRTIRIHGSDQLERPTAGFLGLIWCRLGVVPPGQGDTVPAVIERCLQRAHTAELLSRLDQLGLPSMGSVEVKDVAFDLLERRTFYVDDDFPRITPDRFAAGAVPPGVQGVEYMVDLDVVPALEQSVSTMISRFVESA